MYACVAETQGLLGFIIQSSLSYHLGYDDVVSLVSISYVSKNDPAFKKPSKPVGPVYDKDELKGVRKLNPASMFKEISANKFRRLVASPDPISVSNSRAVKELLENGYVVITAGGGGIPAIRNDTRTMFVDAVVDKDLASERLATSIGASKLVMLTNVEGAYLDYDGNRKLLKDVTVREMRAYLENGEFEEGSMAPKVRAAMRFAENTGNSAIICNLAKLSKALTGRAGTIVHK
jgi:carbamate kinase